MPIHLLGRLSSLRFALHVRATYFPCHVMQAALAPSIDGAGSTFPSLLCHNFPPIVKTLQHKKRFPLHPAEGKATAVLTGPQRLCRQPFRFGEEDNRPC